MNSFNILSKLGKGTFGTVYLCERKHNKMKVVVKKVDTDLSNTQLDVAKNEVAILKSLKHPNIVLYHDSFLSSGAFYIIMEYANQGSLYEFIKQRKSTLLTQDEVLDFFCQILHGLSHIHSKNIIHRDLKSENIFLTGSKADLIKIGDFGISKILTDYKTNTVIGTTNYLAPEICQGQPYDTKSDIWSLGCILYELCALERMFEGPVANVVCAISTGRKKQIDTTNYDPILQNLLDMMLQLAPENRPCALTLTVDPVLSTKFVTLAATLGCI